MPRSLTTRECLGMGPNPTRRIVSGNVTWARLRVGTLPQTSFDLRQRAPQLAFEHRSVRHRSLLQMRLQAGKAEKQSDAQRHP